jgi:phosphoribosyl-dephospho-CoA transferase
LKNDNNIQERTRYLTPYNFLICAQSAVYNSREADAILEDFLDEVLEAGKDYRLEEFIEKLLKIPMDNYRIDFDIEGN